MTVVLTRLFKLLSFFHLYFSFFYSFTFTWSKNGVTELLRYTLWGKKNRTLLFIAITLSNYIVLW